MMGKQDSRVRKCAAAGLAALSLVGIVLVQQALNASYKERSVFPPCRKSVEIHPLKAPALAGGADAESSLFFFGGKGYVWQRSGHLDVASGHSQWKKHVTYFGMEDMWQFSPTDGKWRDTQLVAGTSAPSARWKFAASAFDNDTRLVLFGGCVTLGAEGVMNDLWVFEFKSDGSGMAQWRQVTTKDPPAPRRGHVVAANGTHLVIFGGKSYDFKKGHSTILHDIWSLPLEALREGADSEKYAWTPGPELEAKPRWGSTGVVLRNPRGSGNLLGIYGGRNYLKTGKHPVYKYYRDLFVYDFEKEKWEYKHPEGDWPQARDHHGAARVGDEMFVFGGRVNPTRDANATLSDVWSWSPKTGLWTEHPKGFGKVPAPRFMPGVTGMALDGEDVLAVAGGEVLPGSTKLTTINDFWAYLPTKGMWKELRREHCGPQEVVYRDSSVSLSSGVTLGAGHATALAALAALFLVAVAAAGAASARDRRGLALVEAAPAADPGGAAPSSTPYVALCAA